MKQVILLCAAGMSTSLLVQKMKDATTELDYPCEIEAHPIAEADMIKDRADIILLGPQVRFQMKKVQQICPGVLVETINPADYGQMNGKKVLEHVKEVLGE